ncbi:MAG: ATP-binding cassette domain-containing protein [bacterium]|nr:MAG: ATP-binding cassette domain-containing protein [bacterium]
MSVISAKELSRRYWFYEKEPGMAGALRSLFSGRRRYVDAVRMLDLEVGLGEVIGFLGPNGAGKTTTLKMLCGILHPSSGHLEVLGHRPSRREKDFLRQITYVAGQRNRLFWDLPAEDYFSFCQVLYEIPDPVYRRNLDELVELAGIGEILNVPQRKLSAGQRKRCEIVGALLHDPRLILLDEPTNALDLINARRIRRFIQNRSRDGRHTFLVTSHNMSDIEGVCDRVVVIDGGTKVFDGPITGLNRQGGHSKQVRVTFSAEWKRKALEELGSIVRVMGDEVTLEVPPDRAAAVARTLLDNFPVRDISVTEPTLERVIEGLYEGREDGEGEK